jgi:hypothetical protein
MRIWHAAALALLGWYLMVPPVVQRPGGCDPLTVKGEAPLIEWEQFRSFDSAEICEAAKEELINRSKT